MPMGMENLLFLIVGDFKLYCLHLKNLVGILKIMVARPVGIWVQLTFPVGMNFQDIFFTGDNYKADIFSG